MSTPIIGSGKTTLSTHRKTRQQASYKKDWLVGHKYNTLEERPSRVEWQGYLFRESDDHIVPVGWCTKGLHLIHWNLRHGHIEECMWRKGKLYGK